MSIRIQLKCLLFFPIFRCSIHSQWMGLSCPRLARRARISFFPQQHRGESSVSGEGGERTTWRTTVNLFCTQMTRVKSLASVRKPWSLLSVFLVVLIGKQERGLWSGGAPPSLVGWSCCCCQFLREKDGFSRERPETNFVQDAGGFSDW